MGFSVEYFFMCYLEKGYIIDRLGGGYKNNKKKHNFEYFLQDNKNSQRLSKGRGVYKSTLHFKFIFKRKRK